MKLSMVRNIAIFSTIAIATGLLFQNCSQHHFEEVSVGNYDSNGSLNGGDDINNDATVGNSGNGSNNNSGDTGGGDTGGTTNPGDSGCVSNCTPNPLDPGENSYPKFETGFKNPPKAGDYANFYVTFLQNLEQDFEADWYTADQDYKKDPSLIGQPGVHYVSATGRLKIVAGQKQTIYKVKSLVWDLQNTEENRIIPTRIRNCTLGGKAVACSSLYTGVNREIQ